MLGIYHSSIPVLMYGSETMLWKEEKSKIRDVQMDNLLSLFVIRRMDRVLNAWIRKLWSGSMKGLMKVFSVGSAIWRGWRMIDLMRVCW